MNEAAEPVEAGAGPRWQVQVGVGMALLLVAAALWFDARNLPAPPTVGVGPTAAMRLVGAFVGVLGLAHFASAWRSRQAVGLPDADAEPGNKGSLALVLGGLVGQILLLELGAGFVLSALWLFLLTARGFGQPIGAKAVGIGAALALSVYLFFTRALSLALPAGPLERWLP